MAGVKESYLSVATLHYDTLVVVRLCKAWRIHDRVLRNYSLSLGRGERESKGEVVGRVSAWLGSKGVDGLWVVDGGRCFSTVDAS